jgi:hypothetical protein
MEQVKRECIKCSFFYSGKKVVPSYEKGDCRRHAPRCFQIGDTSEGLHAFVGWPRVHPDDFCGDFEPDGGSEHQKLKTRLENPNA